MIFLIIGVLVLSAFILIKLFEGTGLPEEFIYTPERMDSLILSITGKTQGQAKKYLQR